MKTFIWLLLMLPWCVSGQVVTRPAFVGAANKVEAAGGGGGATATNNFDAYVNDSELGTNTGWTNIVSGGGIVVFKPGSDSSIFSSTAKGAVAVTTPTFTANHYSAGTLTATSGSYLGVAVRCSTTAENFYYLVVDTTGALTLGKDNAGTTASIVDAYPAGISDNTRIKLSVTGTGSATRLTAYTNGVIVPTFNAVDPGGTYIDGGKPGISGFVNSSGSTLDFWDASDL